MIAADGRTVWLHDIVTVVVENNQPAKLRGIMVDVTIDMSIGLRKRMEEQRLDLALVNCATRPLPTGGEVVYRERLVWAGAKCGSAHRRDPPPLVEQLLSIGIRIGGREHVLRRSHQESL